MQTLILGTYSMVVRQAGPADGPVALAILVPADRWLQSQGVRQWGHYLSGEGEADLLEAVEAGDVYLVWQGERAVGTISLQLRPSQWDRTIWGDVPDDEAVYVHRLAIDREFAGQGLGSAMLDWAETYARSRGRRFLRLDCVAGNEALNGYYAKRFTYRGQSENIGMRFSRYEKELLRFTFCLIRRGDQLLLLNRVHPPNMGLWVGPGGKLEPGEAPLACVLREVYEETGIRLDAARFAGVVTWEADGIRVGGMYLFVADVPADTEYRTPRATPEGILDWKPIDWVLHPDNRGVTAHLPKYLRTALEHTEPYAYHGVWESGRLLSCTKSPLEV